MKPVRVDELNGYRDYAADQLPLLHRILALKELGFTLEQVGELTRTGFDARLLRAALDAKRRELQARVREEEALIARVETRLRQIEEEPEIYESELIVKPVEPMLVASVRGVVPNYPAIGTLMGEFYAHLVKNWRRPSGPAIARWRDPETKECDVDAEAAVPIDKPVKDGKRVRCYELPSETMACLDHKGAFNTLSRSYEALNRWNAANGYRPAGACREVYLYCG